MLLDVEPASGSKFHDAGQLSTGLGLYSAPLVSIFNVDKILPVNFQPGSKSFVTPAELGKQLTSERPEKVRLSQYRIMEKKNVCTFKLRLCFDTVNVKNYSDWANISQAKLTLVTVIYL